MTLTVVFSSWCFFHHRRLLSAPKRQMLLLLQCHGSARVSLCLTVSPAPLTLRYRTLAGPTFSGFIVGNGASWTIEYWYNVGLEAFVVLLVFFCLEETGWNRPGKAQYPARSHTFFGRVIDAYFFRKPIVPLGRTNSEVVSTPRFLASMIC